MNQSDRTLAYHLQTVRDLGYLAEFPDRLNREYDPNAQAEQVERGCPVCGRLQCPLDVRRGL